MDIHGFQEVSGELPTFTQIFYQGEIDDQLWMVMFFINGVAFSLQWQYFEWWFIWMLLNFHITWNKSQWFNTVVIQYPLIRALNGRFFQAPSRAPGHLRSQGPIPPVGVRRTAKCHLFPTHGCLSIAVNWVFHIYADIPLLGFPYVEFLKSMERSLGRCFSWRTRNLGIFGRLF